MEDLQWIDSSSRDYLDSVVDTLANHPVFLLCTYREGYTPAWDNRAFHQRLALDPFTEDETAQMVAELVDRAPVTGPARELIVKRAEGNPLFIEELTAYLKNSGLLTADDGAALADAGVPATIQDLLTARIDRLPESAKRLLQAAAVLGREFSLPLLEAVAARHRRGAGRRAGDAGAGRSAERDRVLSRAALSLRPPARPAGRLPEPAGEVAGRAARARRPGPRGALRRAAGGGAAGAGPSLLAQRRARQGPATISRWPATGRAASSPTTMRPPTTGRRSTSPPTTAGARRFSRSSAIPRTRAAGSARPRRSGPRRWPWSSEPASGGARPSWSASWAWPAGTPASVERALDHLERGRAALGDDTRQRRGRASLPGAGRASTSASATTRRRPSGRGERSPWDSELGAPDVVSHAYNTLGVAHGARGRPRGGRRLRARGAWTPRWRTSSAPSPAAPTATWR